MSLDTKNQKCAVCSAYLFEEDDVVYCPICGAPHHRECYLSIGKCGLDEFHGTDKQYRREEAAEEKTEEKQSQSYTNPFAKSCRSCGMPLDEGSPVCSNCGMPSDINPPPFGASPFNIQPLNPNTPITDEVNVGEAAGVIRANSFRYIPKFLSLNGKRKRSWNWAAFLLPHGWFAFRKMYKESIITTILMIASAIMSIPFSLAIAQLPSPGAAQSYLQLGQHYAQYIDKIGPLPLILAGASIIISFAIRIVSGIYGDYIYKQRVLLSASLIKKAEDKDAAKHKYCGTSFIGFFLAVLAFEFIPTVITLFL